MIRQMARLRVAHNILYTSPISISICQDIHEITYLNQLCIEII